jgi:low affinity Fe/Cu permease
MFNSEGEAVVESVSQNEHRHVFDRFAEASSNLVSRAPFFVFCVALVVVWAPTYPLIRNFDTWQLLINTPTTILTFLLVAVLQNSQRRAEIALQHKIDALADGLADLMEHFLGVDPEKDREDLSVDIDDLREAVGLEKRVSTSD